MTVVSTKRRTGGGLNKGKKPGQKRPFTVEQVQLIRMSLRAKGDVRELALFEMALTSMLRAVDLLALTVADVTDGADVAVSFRVRQEKTDEAVRVDVSEAAREAVRAYLATLDGAEPGKSLWPIGRIRYSQLVKGWARAAYVDPRFYSTHSMRRTQAAHLYRQTNNQEAVRQLLGHKDLAHTSVYLGVSRDEAGALKRRHEM